MSYREEVNRLLDVDNQGWGTDDVDRLREIFNKLMNRDDSRRDRERPMSYREEFNKHLDAMVAREHIEYNAGYLRETFNKLMDAVDSNSKYIDHLKYANKSLSDKLDNLKNDNMKLSEQLDNRGREVSLSLDDLKELTEVLMDCNYMVPSCFWKLVKMMERYDVPTPKEMTVVEIERVLGHSIKVVK
jgi:hypothetical protein